MEIKEFATIPMSNDEGVFAMIDPEDYEKVSAFGKWYINDSGYAVKKTRLNGKNIHIRMHRLVNNTPANLQTDHINGDRLDNRKQNLRTVSQMMNTWNITKPKAGKKYDLPPGITFDYSRNKYYASRTQRKRFDNLEDAVKFTKGEL